MSFFQRSPILLDEATVAEQLRRGRQAKNITLAEAAKRLKIRVYYLEALEKGQYHSLPTGVYGRNFVREYALFLGLDSRYVLAQFARETNYKPSSDKDLFERKVVSRSSLIVLPQLLRNAIIGFLITACLVYLVFLLQRIFEPPMLVISYPPDNFTTTDINLSIKGQSDPESDIKINGQNVLADNQGHFEREVYLQQGINVIIITSEKKYSRTATVTKQVLVK